jgi:hypothetical protein
MSSNSSLTSHPLDPLNDDDDDNNIRLEIGSGVTYKRASSHVSFESESKSSNNSNPRQILYAAAATATSFDSIHNITALAAAAAGTASLSESISASESSVALINAAAASAALAANNNKPKQKRIAPKIPDKAIANSERSKTSPARPTFNLLSEINPAKSGDEEKFTNFYIDIEQVRWFYKNDKEPTTSQTSMFPSSASTLALSSASNSSSYNLAAEAAAHQQSHQLHYQQSLSNLNSPTDTRGPSPPPPSSSDINNNSGSNNNSTIHTSKKWHMFSKWDSINLEVSFFFFQ